MPWGSSYGTAWGGGGGRPILPAQFIFGLPTIANLASSQTMPVVSNSIAAANLASSQIIAVLDNSATAAIVGKSVTTVTVAK
jgi:hypothetical protein